MSENLVIPTDFIENVRKNNNDFFVTRDFFYNGIYYHDNQGDFVVIARESKNDFNDQLQSWLHNLNIVSIIGLVSIYFFSNYLGYIAYQPIVRVVEKLKERDVKNLNKPLVLKSSYAEIEDLVKTYNLLTERISQTFLVQKNFIDYVSHELRTPITALLGTLEVTNQKSRNIEEYQNVLLQLKQYTTDLHDTLDQMMLLSGAKTNFEFEAVRIDEVVWKVIENAVLYHNAQINVDLQVENDALLTIQGNEKLLEVAFNNLVGNAIKYSDNSPIQIQFLESENKLKIQIIDQGIGIDEKEINQITQNFYRGKNTQDYQGKGIGLSMSNIILISHQIDLKIVPNHPKGTIVQLFF